MKRKTAFVRTGIAVGVLVANATACNAKLVGVPVRNTGHYAIIDTDHGTVVIELYPKAAPKTVENFETLAKKGFYNGLTFHRVVPGFVVQGGDPKGDGSGGPGYDVTAEIRPAQNHLHTSVATPRLGPPVNPERKSSSSQD